MEKILGHKIIYYIITNHNYQLIMFEEKENFIRCLINMLKKEENYILQLVEGDDLVECNIKCGITFQTDENIQKLRAMVR